MASIWNISRYRNRNPKASRLTFLGQLNRAMLLCAPILNCAFVRYACARFSIGCTQTQTHRASISNGIRSCRLRRIVFVRIVFHLTRANSPGQLKQHHLSVIGQLALLMAGCSPRQSNPIYRRRRCDKRQATLLNLAKPSCLLQDAADWRERRFPAPSSTWPTRTRVR